ncbi:non-homologous end-joining factor 1 [Rhinophrynus dorsalis]
MSLSQHMDDQLLKVPWRSLHIGECRFLSKVCFTESGYALLLSDLSGVWCEEAEGGVIQERSRELNKRLKAPVSSFLGHLSQLLLPLLDSQDNSSNDFSCLKTVGALMVQVKSQLSGLPFYWDFHCKEASVSTVCRHFVRPLLLMTEALEYQSQELCVLLRKKDAEIQDYQESGAVLSRDRLKTVVFDEQSFQESFLAEKTAVVSDPRKATGFSDWLQRLYSSVTASDGRPNSEGADVRCQASLSESVSPPDGREPSPSQGGSEVEPSLKSSQLRSSGHCAQEREEKKRRKSATAQSGKSPMETESVRFH